MLTRKITPLPLLHKIHFHNFPEFIIKNKDVCETMSDGTKCLSVEKVRKLFLKLWDSSEPQMPETQNSGDPSQEEPTNQS